MVYPITFHKDKAEEWSDALAHSMDMRFPDGGWGVYDMLTLAGVCMMGVMTHGPIRTNWIRRITTNCPRNTVRQVKRPLRRTCLPPSPFAPTGVRR